MKPFLFYRPETDDVNWERLERLRFHMASRRASICAERALLYTESFQKTEGQPYILRKAQAFAHTLANMTIYLEEDALLFGNQASRCFAAPIFPEYSIDWVIDELDSFEHRDGDVFQIDEPTKEALRSIQGYWHGHTHEDRVNANLTDLIRGAEKQGILHRGGISMSGDGHIVPDHPMVLKRALRSFITEAEERLADPSLSESQKDFYQAVIVSMNGALHFFKRYAALYEKEAARCDDPVRKQELLELRDLSLNLLERPAQSFHEGLEAVYMIHVLQMIESNGHSFCYGRFDQYMLELYQHDLDAGVISRDRARELITNLFLMTSTCNKVRPYGHTRFSQGYPLYSNLVVGGLTPQGEDGTNDLS